MDSQLLVVALGAGVAGFVQGLSGFAFGMVAMSIWAWTVEPRLAAVMAVFGGLSGQLLAALSMRRRLDVRLLLPFVAGGVLGIPIGVALLPRLDLPLFKAVLGSVLLVFCPAMLLSSRLPRVRAGGRLADGLVGVVGGVMGGLGGFTGIAPSLWCTLRGFDKEAQRAVIQNFNLGMLALTMAGYIGGGLVTPAMLPMFMVVLPAMLIPTFIGTRVYVGIGEALFRRIVLGLLSLSGVAMLASALPRVLGWA
jgi:uncharacterized membrane protein YfcA